ncbi:NAD-dependent epimerase/dehydratase family protein [Mesoflavibacter sp. CH_XMU1404-2]|uniref:NAD-dependent epimerase/dehydratase family protein n=1 Tax=Mesoflavibacter sp. CH_XMU1404-2 TaxID=3107766 RepID=UPI003008CDDD
MILVTGGTGLVGAHLLFHLLNENKQIRAIYRNEKKFENVKRIFSYYSKDADTLFNKIEWVEADLNNIPQLTEAFKDITHVYHCAAFVSFEPDKFDVLKKTNIKGTANVVNFCISNKVEKLCYVSSIAALGSSLKNEVITEETEWNKEIDNSVYAITKYGAELEVWRGTQEGLDAVIVNPGVIIGPGIWRYGSGSLIKMIYNGLKYYTTGSTGYVDVNDVVKAMIQLVKSNHKNERYILVSENLSFKAFFTKTANYLGVKPPQKEAKPWLLNIAWRLDWLKHKLTGKRRVLSKQTAKSALTETNYSNKKIKEAIGFEFLPMDKSIEITSSYFLDSLK